MNLSAGLYLRQNPAQPGATRKPVVQIGQVGDDDNMLLGPSHGDVQQLATVIVVVIALYESTDRPAPADALRDINDDRCLFIALVPMDCAGAYLVTEALLILYQAPNDLRLRRIRGADAESPIIGVACFAGDAA
jgi:hypothetical protein